MAYNKVKYGSKTLIDLTNDTVTPDKLLSGIKAHDKSGSIIIGTFLKEYPSFLNIQESVQDSSGKFILDSNLGEIVGQIIYEKK